jgi:uncharacterized phiE125 gp8 family phage protein
VKSITIDYDAATTLPLDVETLKNDLRISGTELDAILTNQYVPAALSWAEGFTRRSLLSRAHRWIVSDFPRTIDQTLFIPRGLVSAVSSIIYISDGSPVTLTGPSAGSPGGTDYQEDLTGHIARIMPNQGATWPAVDSDAIQPVKVTYTAGWASDALIPGDIKRALTAYVYQAMELDGLLTIRPGFDIDHPEKLLSAWRTLSV